MSMKKFVLILGAVLPLAGCATNQGQGGATVNDMEYNTRADAGEATPRPIASPSFRGGLNPEDPRDTQFGTRPRPTQSPSTTFP
jgi:hypothetical protein